MCGRVREGPRKPRQSVAWRECEKEDVELAVAKCPVAKSRAWGNLLATVTS